MNSIALKAKVGIAACAVAASASLLPIATAEAAPVQAPATPALIGHADAPLGGWWFSKSGHTDLLKQKPVHKFGFIFFNLFNCHKPYRTV